MMLEKDRTLEKQLKNIKLIIADVDGTLTDGGIIINEGRDRGQSASLQEMALPATYG